MKNIILYSILILIISCKQSTQNQVQGHNSNLNQEQVNNNEQIGTIKEFYLTLYGLEDNITNYELRNKYVSKRILKRIDSLSSETNLILDYDPFIQGQDWDIEQLVKTLTIKPLKNKNEFRVSFYQFDKELSEHPTNVDLLLKENDKGEYLIHSILNDDYLNFEENNKDRDKMPKYISNFSNIWYSKYSYKTEPYKLDSLSSVSIYYNINIKKDSITFSGQGYKTNFHDLCYGKENADTLEIYYNKTLEGTDYNKDNKGVIAKLFKNKADYYIISPVIEDGEIQKDIPVLIQKD